MIQTKQMLYFTAAVEAGSLRAAAESLFLAPSALSQSLAALERELGFPLLTRQRSGVVPTELGAQVYAEMRAQLAQLNAAEAEWKRRYAAQCALRGCVRLASVSDAHARIMARVVAPLRENYPNLRCKIVEARDFRMLPELIEGRSDLVLGDCFNDALSQLRASAAENALVFRPLCDDAYAIALSARHPLAAQETLRAEDARTLPLACYSGGDSVADYFFARGFDRALSVEYNSFEKIVAAAEQGRAAGVLPMKMLQSPGRGRHALRFLSLEGFTVPSTHFLAYRADAEETPEFLLVRERLEHLFDDVR